MGKKLSFFPYFGGKYYLAPKIISLFPTHGCYVEVFGGGGNVLFQKPPSKVEIFNDLNSDIYNLFKVLREQFDAFERELNFTPYSREIYDEYREQLKVETDSFRRAVMWYVIAVQSFGGKVGHGWGFSLVRDPASEFRSLKSKLLLVADRLLDVVLENRDFEYVLKHYDSENSFFYLDPPYVPDTRRGGRYLEEMTLDDHERLVEMLKIVKGKVMLSGYKHSLYESLGWKRFDFETICQAVGRTTVSNLKGEGTIRKNQKRVESVWINYEEPNKQEELF